MKKKMEKGLLSLEASITLTIFIFLMLFLYSYFVVFEARNEIAHALLASTNSIAFDAFENEKFQMSGDVSQLFTSLYNKKIQRTDYSSDSLWHKPTKEGAGDNWSGDIYSPGTTSHDSQIQETGDKLQTVAYSSDMTNVVRSRFLAYLGGSEPAEAVLERFHIKGGADGLDFSGTYFSGGKLYVNVVYELDYEYNVFDLLGISFSQSCCSKLWTP